MIHMYSCALQQTQTLLFVWVYLRVLLDHIHQCFYQPKSNTTLSPPPFGPRSHGDSHKNHQEQKKHNTSTRLVHRLSFRCHFSLFLVLSSCLPAWGIRTHRQIWRISLPLFNINQVILLGTSEKDVKSVQGKISAKECYVWRLSSLLQEHSSNPLAVCVTILESYAQKILLVCRPPVVITGCSTAEH